MHAPRIMQAAVQEGVRERCDEVRVRDERTRLYKYIERWLHSSSLRCGSQIPDRTDRPPTSLAAS